MLRPVVPNDYFRGKKDLIFQMIDWQDFDTSMEMKSEDDEGDDEDKDVDYSFSIDDLNKPQKKKWKKRNFIKKQIVRGYGLTEEGHSICINVLNFQPYFYIDLPDILQNKDNFNYFIDILKVKVGEWHSGGLVSAEIVEKKRFYGFTNNELFKFAKLTFHSSTAYNGFKTKLQKEKIYLSRFKEEFDFSTRLCETKVKSMLRFFHTQNIDPAGWMKIQHGNYTRNVGVSDDKYDISNKHSRCQIEVNCDYKYVEKVAKNTIGPLLVASYDIECVSQDGSFPKASKPLDPVIQIGTTVYEFGKKDCKLSYVATLGKCDPIENSIVESFKTEKELILGWAKFMAKLDPDIITGYNIWGFDWKYLYERASTGNGGLVAPYHETFFKTLQRTTMEKKIELTEQRLSSSALGDNFLYFVDIEGVVQIDLLKVMQRDYKLDSYKLDNVAKNFLKMQKEDLPYKQLFLNYKRGTPKDIQEIAIYCIKDCDLVNRLMDDRQVIVSNMGMANVCVVPFSYLFLKGQGIKIFSLVAKITRQEDFVVKDLDTNDIDQATYEGAIVFVPDPNVYFEPVVVMDYNSLYPSSMIAENISHDSIIGYKEYRLKKKEITLGDFKLKSVMKDEKPETNSKKKIKKGNLKDDNEIICNESNCELIKNTIIEKYDNLPDYNYNDVEYDVYEGVGDDKVKVGYKVCRYAEAKNGEKALLPRILRVLLKARKDTRKKMEYQNMYMRDGSIKVGIVTTSDKRAVVSEIDPKADPNDFYIFEEDKNSAEEYNVFHVIDGNYKVKKCDIIRVEDTHPQNEIDVLDGLQLAYKVVCNSLYGQVGATTSPICYKELAACTTATGRRMVIHARDTTLKHFVGAKLTYGDSVTGDTPILLKDTKSQKVYSKPISELCSMWESYEAFKPWDNTLNEKEQGSFKGAKIWTANGWAKINRVIRHKTVKKIYRVITRTGCVDVTEDHSLLSPDLEQLKPKDVAIGTELRHGFPFEFQEDKSFPYSASMNFDLTKDSLKDIQKLFINLRKNGEYVWFEKCSIAPHMITISSSKYGYGIYDNQSFNPNEIIDIQYLRNSDENEYVYDIETTDGTFQAGIGQMIVKNTDSIFVNFTDHIKQKYPNRIFTEEELLEESIKVGQEAAKNVNRDVKAPQNIEYEKTFWPFVIFSKKRYFGNKYEKSIKKYKETSMGIVLKRRDNAPILKTIYKGIIDIILNKRDMEASKLFFRESVKSLLEGTADISQLVISKTLKAEYANPTQIAHKVLADRMGERDEGNKPQSNDRIPYCYIDATNWKCSICKGKVTQKNCKCTTCMGMFCFQHLGNHRTKCTPVCRFCKVTDKILKKEFDENNNKDIEKGPEKLKKCNTCTAYYCEKCFDKHKLRKDKYGNIHQDKCKKPIEPKMLQGDLIENPQYIQDEKLKIDFMYYYEHQIKKPVYQIFELKMNDPESIVRDLLVKYDNQKNNVRPISDFFNVKKKKVNDDMDDDIIKLVPKKVVQKEETKENVNDKNISLDINEIKVNDSLKNEIFEMIQTNMKKKEKMYIADIQENEEGNEVQDENAEDINLALEIFEDVEDLIRDINDID